MRRHQSGLGEEIIVELLDQNHIKHVRMSHAICVLKPSYVLEERVSDEFEPLDYVNTILSIIVNNGVVMLEAQNYRRRFVLDDPDFIDKFVDCVRGRVVRAD